MKIDKPSTVGFPSLDANTSYQLWLAANCLQRAFRKGLVPLRLTFVQFFVLAAVSRITAEQEASSQAEVCRFCDMDANMISQVVKAMAAKGLLIRSESRTDRRVFNLTLTPVGETLLIAAHERMLPISASFFAPLGERRLELTEMLRRVLAAQER